MQGDEELRAQPAPRVVLMTAHTAPEMLDGGAA